MFTSLKRTFQAALLPLIAFAALSLCYPTQTFAQTNPTGLCGAADSNNQRPVFASGASNTIWACNPSAGTANWVQIYPAAGTTSTSGSVLAENNIFGDTALKVCHAQYSFAVDGGGAPGLITPINNCVLPINSTVITCGLNWTTAALPASTNTISVGLSGTGGGVAVLLAATNGSASTGVLQCAVLPQTASGWKKLTTAGAVTLTTATSALTAGVLEVYVIYFVSST